MNEKKLKKLWQKVKDKWADPKLRKEVYCWVIGGIAFTGYTLLIGDRAYCRGYNDGNDARFSTDNFSLSLMKQSGFVIIDETKVDDFYKLLEQHGYIEK